MSARTRCDDHQAEGCLRTILGILVQPHKQLSPCWTELFLWFGEHHSTLVGEADPEVLQQVATNMISSVTTAGASLAEERGLSASKAILLLSRSPEMQSWLLKQLAEINQQVCTHLGGCV